MGSGWAIEVGAQTGDQKGRRRERADGAEQVTVREQASALEELFACGFDAGLLAVWSESVAAGSLDGAKAKQQLSDSASSGSKGTASLAAPAGQAIRAEQ